MQKKENIVTLYDKLTEAGFADKFKISITDSHEFYGYTYLIEPGDSNAVVKMIKQKFEK
ncbi:MAG: hypothetical protein MJ123_11215 [Lachnospiraceae bacterium]|nr:hypothetical protein [Lachnospiraceae bacterium]